MSNPLDEQDQHSSGSMPGPNKPHENEKLEEKSQQQKRDQPEQQSQTPIFSSSEEGVPRSESTMGQQPEGRPVERTKGPGRTGARGTAAMDPKTRQEVARKGGLAVSRNKQHMAEIGRKGGQSVSKNREHMAQIGRKGGAASRGHR